MQISIQPFRKSSIYQYGDRAVLFAEAPSQPLCS